MFSIQASRGPSPIKVNDGARTTRFSSSNVYTRYHDDKNRLSEEADFLFSFSTLEDHESLRVEEDGPWYIQMLCKAIREEDSKEISAILRYAHLLVSQLVGTSFKYSGYLNVENEIVEVKMVPTYEDRLTNLFYIAEPQQV